MIRFAAFPALWLLASCNCNGNPPVTQDAGPLTCTAPLVACSASCVDTRIADSHCGGCDVACGQREACAGSRCYATVCNGEPCAVGQVCVSGFCVDKACFGVVCPDGQTCAAGACYPNSCGAQSCPADQVCVSGACVDASCVGVLCPSGSRCVRGACQFDTCGDSVKNGTETDVDCGGSACPGCLPGKSCDGAADCTSRNCVGFFCAAPTCADLIRNGGEGDVDCGGACLLCAPGRTCQMASQCREAVCTLGVCAPSTCSDTQKNGQETGVDCGGGCIGCPDGTACLTGADCVSSLCTAGRCTPSQCVDGVKNGAETDLDCGGACVGCMNGQVCDGGTDCLSRICNATKHCAAPTCSDLAQNGTETDLDCGGATCPKCAVGLNCDAGSDCLSLSCAPSTKRCIAPSCSDGVKNASEADVDCGGPGTCPRCGFNRTCTMPGDCASGVCTTGRCTMAPVFASPPTTFGAPAPTDVVARDLDGDGNIDLAVTEEQGYAITLYWGDGDGGFVQTPGPVLAGTVNSSGVSGPRGLATGDFNGDGKLDLFVGRDYAPFMNPTWCIFTLLRGAGGRVFSTPQDFVVSSPATGCGETVVAFRHDGDALDDVLISSDLEEPLGGWLWTGVASGNPAPPVKVPEVGAYATVGDVNADGVFDIVSHRYRQSQVSVHLGLADGGFAAPTYMPVPPGQGRVVLGRIDSDALVDIAVVSDSARTISFALGFGDGTFQAAVGVPGNGGLDVAIVDIDRDGTGDLLSSGINLMVTRGKGNGMFYPGEPYNDGCLCGVVRMALADFNHDGRIDVAQTYRATPSFFRTYLNISP